MKNIIEMRHQRGWTQVELAEKAGVSQSTISQIESGDRKRPSFNNIKRIAKALGTSIEELTHEDE